MLQRRLFVAIALLTLAIVVPASAWAEPRALPPGFSRQTLASGLDRPTSFVPFNGGFLVTERSGIVRVVLPDGSVRSQPFLTVDVPTDAERGLLGIALHPRYPERPFVYIYYTTGPNALNYSGSPKNRLSRFRSANGIGVDEKILLDDIPSDTGYHNSGDLEFGFDGMLYVTVGDGGKYWMEAQNLRSLSGKILRLKPNGKIPHDNPYYNRAGLRWAIYAFGFRNPFRLGLRSRTQSYFAADVGDHHWEELDKVLPKGNYGWPLFEGPCPLDTECDPSQADYGKTRPPVYYYDSSGDLGDAIIGGVFAESKNYPLPYRNSYFFGDTDGWIHVLRLNRQDRPRAVFSFDSGFLPTQFRLASDGNVQVLDYSGGSIYEYVYQALKP